MDCRSILILFPAQMSADFTNKNNKKGNFEQMDKRTKSRALEKPKASKSNMENAGVRRPRQTDEIELPESALRIGKKLELRTKTGIADWNNEI